MIGLKYGSFNMQDPAAGIWTVEADVFSSPQRKIQADALAEADGALIVQQRYESKTFPVSGRLRSSTRAGLEALMDNFKVAMGKKNQPLDIDFGGGVRRYLANPQNVTIADRGLTSAGFTVQFLSPDGTGWAVDSSSLIDPTGITASGALITFTAGGTYKVEPIIRVAVNTLTTTGSQKITLSNSETLRGMSVTRAWSAGDLLEIDVMKGTVYVNSIAVEPAGQFPSWEPGSGGLQYNDEFSSRDVTISSSYTKRYL